MRTMIDGNVRDRSKEAGREIRHFIEAGISKQTLKPGDKLPTEREIASRFMAARNTVRKTLDSLEQEGIIIREVGRGTFVSGKPLVQALSVREPVILLASRSGSRSTDQPARPDGVSALAGTVDCRTLGSRASGADIGQMQAAIDQSRVAKSLQQFEDCDDALHKAIAASTRNPLFSAFAVIVTEIRN